MNYSISGNDEGHKGNLPRSWINYDAIMHSLEAHMSRHWQRQSEVLLAVKIRI
jgi:hypothetical protein